MNKLQMAHEYAKELAANYGDVMQFSEVLEKSWWLADSMFEEFEKREKEESAKKRVEIQKLLNADNTFVEREGQHFDDVEWQPDWSLAPKNAVACAMDADKSMWWHGKDPKRTDVEWLGDVLGEYKDHGYVGDWRDSFHIRPEGV